MGKILYLECNSGISGDMTVGALLDLGADRQVLEKGLASLGVDGYHLHFGRKTVCGLDSFDFDVHLEGDGYIHEHENEYSHGTKDSHGSEHSHGPEHSHRSEHSHDLELSHDPEHSHGAEPGYSHSHSAEHGHGPEHNHAEHGCSHSHSHSAEHGHSPENNHDPEHSHGAEYGHSPENNHDPEYGHSPEHSHGPEYSHGAEHGHSPEHNHSHAHGHPHIHRNLNDIYQIIDRLDSNERVKELARKMFRIVAEAESKAHGLPLEQVHFHEVGAVDSIVDIVSVALCVDNLGIEDVVVSPLAEGYGHVHCQHGILPVPVPATANIASAYHLDLKFTDNNGEMVTPTGAAIAAALGTRKELPSSCRLVKIGMGAGNKVFKQANVLRAMILEESDEEDNSMCVLESNLDDCSGESLGFVMEILLEAGAADVWYTPIFMKKNRPAYMISVICREEDRERLEEIMLIHTTTIGIRRYPVTRTVMEREKKRVHTAWGDGDVKICTFKGRRFCYPEYESVKALCRSENVDFQTVYHELRSAGNGIR